MRHQAVLCLIFNVICLFQVGVDEEREFNVGWEWDFPDAMGNGLHLTRQICTN